MLKLRDVEIRNAEIRHAEIRDTEIIVRKDAGTGSFYHPPVQRVILTTPSFIGVRKNPSTLTNPVTGCFDLGMFLSKGLTKSQQLSPHPIQRVILTTPALSG